MDTYTKNLLCNLVAWLYQAPENVVINETYGFTTEKVFSDFIITKQQYVGDMCFCVQKKDTKDKYVYLAKNGEITYIQSSIDSDSYFYSIEELVEFFINNH